MVINIYSVAIRARMVDFAKKIISINPAYRIIDGILAILKYRVWIQVMHTSFVLWQVRKPFFNELRPEHNTCLNFTRFKWSLLKWCFRFIKVEYMTLISVYKPLEYFYHSPWKTGQKNSKVQRLKKICLSLK